MAVNGFEGGLRGRYTEVGHFARQPPEPVLAFLSYRSPLQCAVSVDLCLPEPGKTIKENVLCPGRSWEADALFRRFVDFNIALQNVGEKLRETNTLAFGLV